MPFRDAEDAVHARDGYNYDGYTLRVEFPRGTGGPGRGMGHGMGMGRGGGMGMNRGGPPSRRSEYRCLVSGQFSSMKETSELYYHYKYLTLYSCNIN